MPVLEMLLLIGALVVSAVFLHYEGLHRLDRWAERNARLGASRLYFIVLAILAVHVGEVLVYAGGFALGARAGLGHLEGVAAPELPRLSVYAFVSAEIFTSLGFGDLYPTGWLRLVAGVECLNGLILIGWSSSFTYRAMRRFWQPATEPPELAGSGPMGDAREPRAGAAADQDTANSALLAATAEPFENLTEAAFSASPKALDAKIAKAEAAASRVRDRLSPEAAGELRDELAQARAAQQAGNPADLAIASNEAYRILVSSVREPTTVPKAVRLLDYAGFRYDADLKAKPTRWGDMNEAAVFALDQWRPLASGVRDEPLRAKLAASLGAMDTAATKQVASQAGQAVAKEQDLVDAPEKYFTKTEQPKTSKTTAG